MSRPNFRARNSHICFPPCRVANSDGPGLEAIIYANGMNKPATLELSVKTKDDKDIRERKRHDVPKTSSMVINCTIKHKLISLHVCISQMR